MAGEGRGHLTASDVARVSSAHGFAWSDEMVDDMVALFSSGSSGGASHAVRHGVVGVAEE